MVFVVFIARKNTTKSVVAEVIFIAKWERD